MLRCAMLMDVRRLGIERRFAVVSGAQRVMLTSICSLGIVVSVVAVGPFVSFDTVIIAA